MAKSYSVTCSKVNPKSVNIKQAKQVSYDLLTLYLTGLPMSQNVKMTFSPQLFSVAAIMETQVLDATFPWTSLVT